MMKTEKGSASTAWIIVVVVVIALLVWWLASGPAQAPTTDDQAPLSEKIEDPETANIAADLEGLDTTDLESEFSDIESDLNQL